MPSWGFKQRKGPNLSQNDPFEVIYLLERMAIKTNLTSQRKWVLILAVSLGAPLLAVIGYNAWVTHLNQRDRALVREALPFVRSEKWIRAADGLRRIRSVVGIRLYGNGTLSDQVWFSIRDREIIWPISSGFHISCQQ